MISAEEYFNQLQCPAVDNLSDMEIQAICLHLRTLTDFNNCEILSLGCGDARIEKNLFTETCVKSLTLLDIAERNLNLAQEKFPQAKLLQMDLKNFSSDKLECYDLIYAISLAQYFTANELHNLHKCLRGHLKNGGKIIYANIPDARRRFLYRINNAIIMKNWLYLLPRYDFIDELSHWHYFKDFYSEGYVTKFLTPAYSWERFDVIMTKIFQ